MLRNKVEIKDDIALIHVKKNGTDQILIVDKWILPYLEKHVHNRLNIDTNGYVQHKAKKNGKYEVHQLHRLIKGAFPIEIVLHKNGNKLDCRWSNLETKIQHKAI